jgi:hypothetical protein
MSQIGSLRYTQIAYFSQPATDRIIYRAIHKRPIHSIVELGVGYAERAQRMIAVASRNAAEGEIGYTGIDFFEDRPPSNPGITLKRAYWLLRQLRASVRLVPGDPFNALARMSNVLTDTDLLVISADQDADALARAWMFVPRMIHDETLIFLQQADELGNPSGFVRLTPNQVDELAGAGLRSVRAAA